MTAFTVLIVAFAIAASAAIAVTCWLERDGHEVERMVHEALDDECEQAAWELHIAEAIRITRGDLDTRINTIRAQIAANHDAEVERFRAELDTWGKPA